MLGSLSNLVGGGSSGGDAPKPMIAISKAMARDGVMLGDALRVKFVIPEEFRGAMEARKFWVGTYKNDQGTTVVPEIRCEQLEGVLEISTAEGFEAGEWYVLSLKEGEVWPLITTHATTEKVFIMHPEEVEEEEEPYEESPEAARNRAQMEEELYAAEEETVQPQPPPKPVKKTKSIPKVGRLRLGASRDGVNTSTSSSSPSSSSKWVAPRKSPTASPASSPRRVVASSSMSPPSPRASAGASPPVGSHRSSSSPRGRAAAAGPPRTSVEERAPPPAVSPRSSSRKPVPEKLIVKMLEELSIRRREYEGEQVDESFTGISLVSWLVATVKSIESREAAVKWGRAMMAQHVFTPHVMGMPFKDAHVPYIINRQHEVVNRHWNRICEEEAVAPPSQLKRRPSTPIRAAGRGKASISPRGPRSKK